MLHDVLPELVVQPQIEAHDRARDDHHGRSTGDRLLVRPLDLPELGDRLLDEADRREALVLLARRCRPARLGVRVRRRARGGTRRGPARKGRLLLRAPCAALLTRLLRHRPGPASGSPGAEYAARTSGSTS